MRERDCFPALFSCRGLNFGGPNGPRASERLDPGLLQVDEALQVVGSNLPG